jgi:ketosteroid isomerase-like protein
MPKEHVNPESVSSAVRDFFATYAAATASVDLTILESIYAESFMFATPAGAQAVKREDFLKVVPRRKAFFAAIGMQPSEVRRLEETELDPQYVLVKAQWTFRFAKDPDHPVTDEGAATYVLRRRDGGFQIVFQLDHQDLTKRAQELGLLTA